MSKALFLAVFRALSAVCMVVGLPALAYTEAELYREFDAREISEAEKRFLQAALAFEGDYNGVIDGLWGNGSQRALERYAARNDVSTGVVPNWMAAILAGSLNERMDVDGWEETFFSALDMSVLTPSKATRRGAPSDIFYNLEHTNSSLGYALTRGEPTQVVGLHEFTLSRHSAKSQPYTVRKQDVWITSSRSGDRSLYTRSDLRGGQWSTIMLSASDGDAGIFAAVTGSIRKGRAPEIFLPSGKLSRGWQTVMVVLARPDDEAQSLAAEKPPANEAPQAPARRGSGTGFLVSEAGHVLTNAHVVDGCAKVAVDGISSVIVASDEDIDLALIRTQELAGQSPAVFAASPALLNSDLTVVGYPLAGLLSGVNVTRGSLTSLKGLGGNAVTMQISAPVQPGNSGGPVLNGEGHVVGVVVSKLDAQVVSEATGDIPQNVNFAIRGEMAKLFLVQSGVVPSIGTAQGRPTPETLAATATGFTKFITCE